MQEKKLRISYTQIRHPPTYSTTSQTVLVYEIVSFPARYHTMSTRTIFFLHKICLHTVVPISIFAYNSHTIPAHKAYCTLSIRKPMMTPSS